MEEQHSLPNTPSSAIEQANQALRAAIRTAYLNRDIPLEVAYEVKPLPTTGNDEREPVVREVWVYQTKPEIRTFKLLTETLTIIPAESGFELEQTIIEEP
ncbi:hypothetical protein [Spirosoma litoris]